MKEAQLVERITAVETQVKEVNRRLGCNDEAHLRIEKSQTDGFKEVNDKIDALPDRLSERYSSKWVEKFIYGLIAAGSVYFLYRLIDEISNK